VERGEGSIMMMVCFLAATYFLITGSTGVAVAFVILGLIMGEGD